MSDTPRTDDQEESAHNVALYWDCREHGDASPMPMVVSVDFARQLERELADMTEKRNAAWETLGAIKKDILADESFGDVVNTLWQEPYDQLERELAEAREQRNKLAAALREIRGACMDETIETNPDDDAKGTLDECIEIAEQALAAVK